MIKRDQIGRGKSTGVWGWGWYKHFDNSYNFKALDAIEIFI
jgi:hypothetical protein